MLHMGSFESLIQGVTQQHVLERLPGQHSAYVNMLCDPTTGPRRRSGVELAFTLNSGSPARQLRSWRVELGGAEYDLFLDSGAGTLQLYSANGVFSGSVSNAYFEAAKARNIDITGIREDLWVCNTEQVVGFGPLSTAPSLIDPASRGFYWVRAAAFSKRYDVKLSVSGVEYSYWYDTPDGTGAGHAASSTPEYIASTLRAGINANTGTTGITAYQVGPVLFFSAGAAMNVTTSAGELHVRESKRMQVPAESDLPPYLPAEAAGVVCSVGNSARARVYFYWNHTNTSWVECGKYGSEVAYANMPRRLFLAAGVLAYDAPEFPARLSGDDNTNPYLPFSSAPYITGMGSCQGRLVLLSGGVVSMSASLSAQQFSRSTVTALLASDPISVTNSGLSSARLRHCLQYNRDLLLFSATHQAVVPSSTTGITPQSAFVALTGASSADTTTPPAQVGRWALFSTPSGIGYSGFGAITPSQYTASQYQIDPITDHLPRYFPGTLQNFVSSGAEGFGFSHHDGDPKSIQVWKFLAKPEGGLVQSAWHTWTFPLQVVSMHPARDTLVISLKDPSTDTIIVGRLNYRLYSTLSDPTVVPFLDLWIPVNSSAGFNLSPAVLSASAATGRPLLATLLAGDLRGEPVGVLPVSGNTYRIDPDAVPGTYAVGVGFVSSFIPSPPLFRDRAGAVVDFDKTQLVELYCTTRGSGEYTAEVVPNTGSTGTLPVSPLTWSSSDLVIGQRQLSDLEKVAVPVEELSATTDVVLRSDSTREFNPIQIGYTLKLSPPRGR